MTIAVITRARKKRLSIVRRAGGESPLRALDRSRQGGMGDTARYGGVRANRRATPHGVPALRWRRRSNSDNNGMLWGAGGRVSPDSPAHTRRESFASGVARLH